MWSNEFISALGGALSLYLGISIAMVFELVEFFSGLMANTYAYTFKGKRPWHHRGKDEMMKTKDQDKVVTSRVQSRMSSKMDALSTSAHYNPPALVLK